MESHKLPELAKALVKAQLELTNPPKSQQGHNYKYADLSSILDITKPVLQKHGLAIVQMPITGEPNTVGVSTILMHESGEALESTLFLPIPDMRGTSTTQAAGAAITYARRYAISAFLNIAADEDTDAAPTQTTQPQRYQAPAPVRPLANTPLAPKASPAQVKKIHTLCSITGADPEKIKSYYKIASMNDISAKDAHLTIEKLEARAEKAEKDENIKPATPGDIKLFDAVLTRKARQSDRDPLELMSEYMLTAGAKTVGELSHDQITQMIDEITTTTKNNNDEVIH